MGRKLAGELSGDRIACVSRCAARRCGAPLVDRGREQERAPCKVLGRARSAARFRPLPDLQLRTRGARRQR